MLAQFFIAMVTVTTGTSARCLCSHPCCGNLCRKVLISLMFLLTLCCAINPNNTTETKDKCSTITPISAYFLEGEDITLTCSTDNIPAENLTFMTGKESSQVPDKFIHKLNDTAIKLIIPNVTAEDIDSSKVSKPYKCGNKHTDECYDNVHVRLEYYPRQPENIDCRIYNFDEMTCTWELGVNYHGPENINVTCEVAWFMYKSDNEAASWTPCPHQNETACHWSSDNYPAPSTIFTNVSVTAIIRNITKYRTKKFYYQDIMEPGPVKDLKVRRASGRRCVELDWQPTHKYYSFKFNIAYSSACSLEPKEKNISYIALENQRFIESRIFCGLTPYTEYTYTVKGILIEEKERDNRTFIVKGYWSAATVLTDRTDSDVPDINPSTSAGLYEIISRPDKDSLRLYWTPLMKCDLHDAAEHVSYVVTAYDQTKQVKHPEFMADIDIPKSKILNVTLQAENSIGPGPNPRVVTIFPANLGPNPSELIIQDNKTEDGCVRSPDIVVSGHQSNFSTIFHTLVWCKGTQLGCQEPIKWNKTEDISFDCDDDYRYGLVTHGYHKGLGQIVDSGIHWEHCIYQLGKKAETPLNNVHLTDVQPGNGFSVEWSQYNCDEMQAFITHYMVTYCVGHGSDDCTCSEGAVSVNVSRKRSSYTVSDLSPGSQLCIWVRGISEAGRGPANTKPLFHTISAKSDGQNILIVVIIVVAVILAVLLVIFGTFRIYKKYQQLQHKEGGIFIPPYEGEEVNIPLTSNGLSLDYTLPGYVSPTGMEEGNGRKYSLGDITEVLEGPYIQPENIDSYAVADQKSDQKHKDESDDVENTSLKTPLLISENQTPPDKSADVDNTCLKRLGNEPLTVIGGAVYVGRPDKVQNDPAHCRDSISSLLSDAHNEQTFSIEDLRCDQNILDQAASLTNENDSVECKNDRMSDILHNCDEREAQENNKCGTPDSAVVRVGKTDDIIEQFDMGYSCRAGDKNASKVGNHSNKKNDAQWNSSAGIHFDEQQLGHHYIQAALEDSDDAVSDKTSLILPSDKCEKHMNDDNGNASNDKQGMNSHQKNDSDGLVSDSGNSSNRNKTSGSLNSSTELHPLSSLKSGTLQSYVTADNETFKEPNCVESSNRKDGNKDKTYNVNGKINGTEQIHKAMY